MFQCFNHVDHVSAVREREEDSQAPPDLEPVDHQQELFETTDMGQFGDNPAYEPSADELIDVLKNLENLAALNPGLYRQIVTQIKGEKRPRQLNQEQQ